MKAKASGYESTIARERAINAESSNDQERATIMESTGGRERATNVEPPRTDERLSEPSRQSLNILVRQYFDYQRERMGLDGRIGRKKDLDKEGHVVRKKGAREVDELMLMYLVERREEIFSAEQAVFLGAPVVKNGKVVNHEGGIVQAVHLQPLWKHFLKDVVGCGEAIAAVIITEIDINKAPTVSNIWSFAGLAPGKDRKVKGQKCPFNQFLRAKLCGVLGSSFLKCNSPYRVFYDDMKHRLESSDWGTASKNPTDKSRPKAGHQHKAATRYMVKMFLRDLYVAWRTLEGLPVRAPYQEEYLGKKHSA